ncbi:MAG: sigma-70 family RNA polymerase sigma factor [Bacteroidota bacterium]
MFLRKRIDPRLDELSDLELLEHYRKHKERRYMSELFGRYVHLVYGACLKYLHEKAASQDMTMVIFERLLDQPPGPEVERFSTWLYVIIRNECVSSTRKQQTDRHRLENWKQSIDKSDYLVSNEAANQLYQVEEPEGIPKDDVHKAINQLSKEQMQCIRLFFFDQKSYKEIATITQFSIKQVKSYLQNGKRNLRHLLSQQERATD